MSLPYSCLILDHDDTAVDSTSLIHYPAHVAVMKRLRPHQQPVNLENWFRKNFDPGIMGFLKDELVFTTEELHTEFKVWREYNDSLLPDFYPGFLDLLRKFRARGGTIAVVSHSEADIIYRHYESATNGQPFLPDIVFGWSDDEQKRKPHPYPVQQILKQFRLKPQEVLVVDDLKPGVEMAKAAGVQVAAVGWSHQIDEIRQYMSRRCDFYFQRVEDLADLILD